MIKLFFMLGSILLSCGPTRTMEDTSSAKGIDPQEQMKEDSIPACIRTKINSYKKAEAGDKPQRVVEYQYKGKKVYYIVMHCCDFYNEVYDDQCKLLGAPDGGFTGRGDGKLPGFFAEASKQKLIWGNPK
jgi:hypothetical protein